MGLKGDRSIAFLLTALGLAYYLQYFNVGINLSDEGFILDGSYRVMRGDIPFADFWSEYMPGQYYLLGLVFKVFGESVLVERVLHVALHLAINLLVYFTACKVMARRYAFLAALLCLLVPSPWHKSYYQVLLILDLFVIADAVMRGFGLRSIILAALTVGVTAYFRQDLSAFFAVVMLVLLTLAYFLDNKGVRKGRPFIGRIAAFFLTYLLTLAPFGLAFLLSERVARGVMYTSDVLQTLASKMRTPYPLFSNLWAWAGNNPDALKKMLDASAFYGSILAVIAVAAHAFYQLFRRDRENKAVLLQFLFMGTALLTVSRIFMRYDFGRLVTLFPILSILYFYIMERLSATLGGASPDKAGRRLDTAIFCAGLAAVLLFSGAVASRYGYYSGTIGVLRDKQVYLSDPRARVYVNRAQAEVINRVTDFVRRNTSPGDRIFAAPMSPMFYFLCDRKGASFLNWMEPGFFDYSISEDDVWAEIQKYRVKVVVINDSPLDGMEERRFSHYAPRLFGLINDNYDLAFTMGTYRVYRIRA